MVGWCSKVKVTRQVCLSCLTVSRVKQWDLPNTNEPRHDKTNKMSVSPAKTQISLGIRPVWAESSCPHEETLGP